MVETAMLQIYSIVDNHTMEKINSQAHISITNTYHGGKLLPLGIFVLKRNFTHVLNYPTYLTTAPQKHM